MAMCTHTSNPATGDPQRGPWKRVLAPGVITTLFTMVVLYGLLGRNLWSIALWALSIVVQIAWIPALSNYSIPFLDNPGRPTKDSSIEKLHLHGLFLLGLGFIFEALGAVLD